LAQRQRLDLLQPLALLGLRLELGLLVDFCRRRRHVPASPCDSLRFLRVWEITLISRRSLNSVSGSFPARRSSWSRSSFSCRRRRTLSRRAAPRASADQSRSPGSASASSRAREAASSSSG